MLYSDHPPSLPASPQPKAQSPKPPHGSPPTRPAETLTIHSSSVLCLVFLSFYLSFFLSFFLPSLRSLLLIYFCLLASAHDDDGDLLLLLQYYSIIPVLFKLHRHGPARARSLTSRIPCIALSGDPSLALRPDRLSPPSPTPANAFADSPKIQVTQK
jgi:hypothetical protein